MKHTVTCKKCGAILEYDDQSIWEGNREREEIKCPICKSIVGYAFTDLTPTVRIIKQAEH